MHPETLCRRPARALLCGVGASLLVLADRAVAQCDPPQLDQFVASDLAPDQTLYGSVAIDGVFAVTTAQGGLGSATTGPTPAYILERIGDAWFRRVKFTPPGGLDLDFPTTRADISGGTVVVGFNSRTGASGQNPGPVSVTVLVKSGAAWNTQATLIPTDKPASSAWGLAVAIDANTIIVGDPEDDQQATNAGAAYVFTRTGSVWTQQAKLLASDPSPQARFGARVAISGNRAVVSALNASGGVDPGAAYVFSRSGSAWGQDVKLVSTDDRGANDQFAESVAVQGDIIAVTTASLGPNFDGFTSGAVSLFEPAAGVWVRTGFFDSGLAQGDDFGFACSVSGNSVLVGAGADSTRGPFAGSGHLFQKQAGAWERSVRIFPANPTELRSVGYAVDLDDDIAMMGGFGDGDPGADRGATHFFETDGSLPQIFSQPADTKVVVGDSVLLSANVFAPGTLTYEWRRDGVPITDGGNVLGATSPQLAIFFSTPEDLGLYDLVVTGPCGPVCLQPFLLTDGRAYVNEQAAPGGSGLAWSTASRSLQEALDLCRDHPIIDEVWVAQGTYRPDDMPGVTPGTREAAFSLVDDLGIFGGFAGGETERDQRDPDQHVTVLSGDLGSPGVPGDNAYQVVRNLGTSSTAVLDGFTIRDGFADGTPGDRDRGAGLINLNAQPTLVNLVFVNNHAAGEGGALHAEFGAIFLTGARFLNNSSGGTGGAVLARQSILNISDAEFEGNTSAGAGAGLHAEDCFAIDLLDTVFSTNAALGAGGGMCLVRCFASLDGSSWTGNTSEDLGGALYAEDSDVVLSDAILSFNASTTSGGGAAVFGGNATITNTRFLNNSSGNGGGLFLGGSAVAQLANSLLAFNDGGTVGGGVSNANAASLTMANCTVAGNSAGSGGGLRNGGTAAASVTNSIFWANFAGGPVGQRQIAQSAGSVSVSFSLLQGGWTGAGSNNLATDPKFNDQNEGDFRLLGGSPAIDSARNPGVPAGIVTDLAGAPRFFNDPATPDTGLSGGAGGTAIVDMGAFEYQGFDPAPFCLGDVNQDGELDAFDFNAFVDAFNSRDPVYGDQNADDEFDAFDFNAFVDNFNAGCPGLRARAR